LKKIAFFINGFYAYRGEQRVLHVIANELSRDYSVTIFTTRESGDLKEPPYSLSKGVTIRFFKRRGFFCKVLTQINRKAGFLNHRIFNSLLAGILFPRKMRSKIVNQINNEGYEAVVGLAEYSMLLGVISNSISAKTVGWMHNSYESYLTKPHRYKNMREFFICYVGQLDKCIVLNEDIQEKYSKNLGIKTQVIYNARSFASNEKSDVNFPMFIACGGFNSAKGFDLLIKSFTIFSKSNSGWNLTIIGDGPSRPQIEKMIKTSNLTDRIKLTGIIKNVEEVMRTASVFLLSSRWEGFPMTVTEALELGLPVIAYDITAMGPLVENGKEGLLAPSFDVQVFAGCMTRLANDESERKRMSKNAIAKTSELSAEKIAAQWKELFEELTTVGE